MMGYTYPVRLAERADNGLTIETCSGRFGVIRQEKGGEHVWIFI